DEQQTGGDGSELNCAADPNCHQCERQVEEIGIFQHLIGGGIKTVDTAHIRNCVFVETRIVQYVAFVEILDLGEQTVERIVRMVAQQYPDASGCRLSVRNVSLHFSGRSSRQI